MDVHVRPAGDGWAAVLDDGRAWPCCVGRGGVRTAKREGDEATPAGVWPVRRVLYRPDRVPAPRSALPVVPIARDDGWCDDPDSDLYNRPVKLPCSAGHEALWRTDGLYDLLVVLGYNDDPPVAGRGSAIFIHCDTPDTSATAGCVALAPGGVQDLVAALTPASRCVIRVG